MQEIIASKKEVPDMKKRSASERITCRKAIVRQALLSDPWDPHCHSIGSGFDIKQHITIIYQLIKF
jgi:hypothetical protein